MKYKIYIIALSLIIPSIAAAMGEDDPLITKVMIDQLEVREAHNEKLKAWDASMYIGKDLNKFWVTTKGEKTGGDTESSEIHALYSHAILPYWDINAGVRHDIKPLPERNWLQLGIQGTTAYFIESEISLFIGEGSRTGLRLEFEKEFMLTQKWAIVPEVEMSFHGHNDKATDTGSGISSLELGIRLHCQVQREFAPYIGLNWKKLYGNTAEYQLANGHDTRYSHVVFGISAWF